MKSIDLVGKEFKVDPVCGMKVDPSNAPFQICYQNEEVRFCSELCKHLFERDPEKYIQSS